MLFCWMYMVGSNGMRSRFGVPDDSSTFQIVLLPTEPALSGASRGFSVSVGLLLPATLSQERKHDVTANPRSHLWSPWKPAMCLPWCPCSNFSAGWSNSSGTRHAGLNSCLLPSILTLTSPSSYTCSTFPSLPSTCQFRKLVETNHLLHSLSLAYIFVTSETAIRKGVFKHSSCPILANLG